MSKSRFTIYLVMFCCSLPIGCKTKRPQNNSQTLASPNDGANGSAVVGLVSTDRKNKAIVYCPSLTSFSALIDYYDGNTWWHIDRALRQAGNYTVFDGTKEMPGSLCRYLNYYGVTNSGWDKEPSKFHTQNEPDFFSAGALMMIREATFSTAKSTASVRIQSAITMLFSPKGSAEVSKEEVKQIRQAIYDGKMALLAAPSGRIKISRGEVLQSLCRDQESVFHIESTDQSFHRTERLIEVRSSSVGNDDFLFWPDGDVGDSTIKNAGRYDLSKYPYLFRYLRCETKSDGDHCVGFGSAQGQSKGTYNVLTDWPLYQAEFNITNTVELILSELAPREMRQIRTPIRGCVRHLFRD